MQINIHRFIFIHLKNAKVETTMRYTHIIPRQKLEAIEVLNSYN